ncbi:hypothetical protein FHS09_004257 [Microbulbifer rhizosphaerae]|uniref:Uncharacterized protein n=1 Tax=Microbulbifer rhizosphaerae TaxID=1562603 RepID=A0A7W4WFR5_9GAMM|nr:hypothetical protein [Microbulbifer rhizosphaerae]
MATIVGLFFIMLGVTILQGILRWLATRQGWHALHEKPLQKVVGNSVSNK